MTNYGTIPTSSSTTSTNLEFVSRAKRRIEEHLTTRRPWNIMFNLHSVSLPHGFSDAVSRIRTNLSFFQMNYAIIVLLVIFLSLLWNPISMIVFVVLIAAWLFLYFLRDQPIVIFGRTITDQVVLVVMAVVTVGLLLLTGAIANILVALLIGAVVVLVHAALRRTDDLFLDEEAAALTSTAS
ncbi:putative prenylated rab acceptor PRA1 [Lupinus albus]|uniref:PRA1 family protein n=1 Tax=Lupinus albus TaxID=3870 RepID=A0A6A4PG42_LUPAL|nr:putative prenylated rab acceptor PRA1 [Lupinus albus]